MKNLLSCLFAFLAISILSASVPNSDGGYAIGDVADDFSLMSTEGNQVSLSDYADAKGFVIIFTCNTCPYAMLYEDRINELSKKYNPQGYHVIAINPNDPSLKAGDSFNEMKKRASHKEFSYPYLFDESQDVFPKFGAKKTPHVFVLDADRVVKYIGAIDDNPREPERVTEKYVEDAITAIDSGEDVEVTYTKAIGCSIKSNKYAKLKGFKKSNKLKKQTRVRADAKSIKKAKS